MPPGSSSERDSVPAMLSTTFEPLNSEIDRDCALKFENGFPSTAGKYDIDLYVCFRMKIYAKIGVLTIFNPIFSRGTYECDGKSVQNNE